MIIVLNNDNMDIEIYKERASRYPEGEIAIFQLPQKYRLGKCLNYAIKRADNGLIAKFDDDDYYGPKFLREAARAIKHGRASIVGKNTAYLYIAGRSIRSHIPSIPARSSSKRTQAADRAIGCLRAFNGKQSKGNGYQDSRATLCRDIALRLLWRMKKLNGSATSPIRVAIK